MGSWWRIAVRTGLSAFTPKRSVGTEMVVFRHHFHSHSYAHQIFYKLFARYTLLTDDGHHILVDARGVFRAGPGADFDYDVGSKTTFLQDDVEYFTHITFEAAGDSPYNWMNGIVAVGVLESVDDKAIIDCWRMTNFPGKEVEDVYVGR